MNSMQKSRISMLSLLALGPLLVARDPKFAPRGATRTGTLDISDLLATESVSVLEYGLDKIQAVLQADLDAHNAIVDDMMGELCDTTTDRQRRYGPAAGGEMVEVDEYGRGPTQKSKGGDTVGFPLKKFQYNIGWTADWFAMKTPADMARQQIAAQRAHVQALLKGVKQALYLPTNYTFYDMFVDNVALSVKRLVNADGGSIPTGPNGEEFDPATHTHYDAIAAVTNAAAKALAMDVLEHHDGQDVRIAINIADETAWRALTEFKPYIDSRLIVNTASNEPTKRVDNSRINNKPIGLIGAAEVWLKPWAIANYPVAYTTEPGAKPLVMRKHPKTAMQGLRIAAEIAAHPLYAQYQEAYFGFGAWTRTAAAILRTDNGTYAAPTI